MCGKWWCAYWYAYSVLDRFIRVFGSDRGNDSFVISYQIVS